MRPLRAANRLLRSNAAAGTLPRTPSSLVQTLRASRPQSTPTSLAAGANNTSWHPGVLARPFSHTPTHQKRKNGNGNGNGNNNDLNGNPNRDNNTTTNPWQTPASAPKSPTEFEPADAINPFDFTDLQTAFDRAEKRFLDDLKKLRTGGRFNADTIGSIPVQPDKKSTQTFPLRELATVAPLGGRRWSILAFEESSVKPIISAVQKSDQFNQQPQRSEENPLELTMTVEPERAEALVKRAKEVCQAWRTRVREEAHKRGEMHKKWKEERILVSDDVYKLREKLQKLQDERMKVILGKEKEVVAGIMARGS